jgi:hypothetical protein
MTEIAVDYPRSPPGARYITPWTWDEISKRIAMGLVWIPVTKPDKPNEHQILNLNLVLRVRLVSDQ